MTSEDRILHLLKTRGPQRAATLASALDITASGVRQHLAALEHAALVAYDDRRESPGRPKRYWQLTSRGHARFPDTHAQLTTELLRSVRAVFGEDGMRRLVAEREREAERGYVHALGAARSVGERVSRLARARAGEGYMAESRREPDGTWLLVENHCPICAAASACEALCRSELELFRRLIGPRATVERVEHLLCGARRCVYRVTPVARRRSSGAGPAHAAASAAAARSTR